MRRTRLLRCRSRSGAADRKAWRGTSLRMGQPLNVGGRRRQGRVVVEPVPSMRTDMVHVTCMCTCHIGNVTARAPLLRLRAQALLGALSAQPP